MNEKQETTFDVYGSIEGTDGVFRLHNLRGNHEKAVTRKRVLQVLANVTIAIIRGEDEDGDGLSEVELMELFQNELNSAFVEQEIKLYRT